MRKRILLVEDNEELLELLTLHLKHEGFSVSTATSGVQAVKKARSAPPDLILLDLMLPEWMALGSARRCDGMKPPPMSPS